VLFESARWLGNLSLATSKKSIICGSLKRDGVRVFGDGVWVFGLGEKKETHKRIQNNQVLTVALKSTFDLKV
jgi:hypothetical protein